MASPGLSASPAAENTTITLGSGSVRLSWMNRLTRVVVAAAAATGSGLKDSAWRSLAPPQPASEPLEPLEPFCCMRAARATVGRRHQKQSRGGGVEARATARATVDDKQQQQTEGWAARGAAAGNRTHQSGSMIGNSSLQAAALTVVSAASLTLLSVLCLRCKKKSKIIREEHQIYNPQMFQRGGSIFAVTQSTTVTGCNKITSTPAGIQEECEDFPTAATDESDYQNVSDAHTGRTEPTYVAPLPITVYENDEITDSNLGVYANISTSSIKDDDDDYENSDFLDQVVKEQEDRSKCERSRTLLYSRAGDPSPLHFSNPVANRPPSTVDEPDYVNEDG